jgi:hypothetical protein
MSEIKKYKAYILEKNNTTDICDIDYSYGNGNQPSEVAKNGIIDIDKYNEEMDAIMFNHGRMKC